MTHELKMFAYCGMSYVLVKGDLEDCRSFAAEFLRRRHADGYPITVHERGQHWELEEPEDAFMVPDDAGELLLRPVERH